jgi:serine/threonine protein kinase
MSGIRKYMSELLQGLAFIHEKRIIHRDIKPTNFLFNVKTGTGVIVDLGLAEKEPENNNECICMRSQGVPRYNVRPEGGYKKDDPRPSRRANRAGTRGFRAPEVLFKCLSQTRKIDIWAAGVILLVFFARRFTFFSSADDSEAVIELATLFGKRAMERCANLHGSILETSIPTITEDGYSFEQVILWCNHKNEDVFTRPQKLGIDLLRHCLDPNVRKRPTAHELLQHPFFKEDFGIDNDLEPRESRKRPASHDVDPAIKKSKLNTHQREQKQHQHNEQQQPELGRLQEEQQPQHDDKQQTELDHHRQKKQPFQYDETQLTELDQHQQEEQPLQHDERQQTELDDHQEETQSLQHDKRHQAEVSQFEAPFCERYDGAQAESEPLARRVTNESAHPTQVGSLPGEQSTQADKPQEIEVRQMEEEEVVIHSLAGLEPENEGWEELTA